jgi:hypothetical protein
VRVVGDDYSGRTPRIKLSRKRKQFRSCGFATIIRCKRFHHPAHRRMFPVLHLDPMLGPSGLIRPVTALHKAHVAGDTEEIRADILESGTAERGVPGVVDRSLWLMRT